MFSAQLENQDAEGQGKGQGVCQNEGPSLNHESVDEPQTYPGSK